MKGRSAGSRLTKLLLPALLIVALAATAIFVGRRGSEDDEPDSAPVATTAPPLLAIGQEGSDGNLAFVVNQFDCPGKELGSGRNLVKAAGRFCTLELKLRNSGSQPVMFLGDAQQLLDESGRAYGPDLRATALTASDPTEILSFRTLNPGIELKVVLIYDVPEAVTPVEAELQEGVRIPGNRGPTHDRVRVRLQPPS